MVHLIIGNFFLRETYIPYTCHASGRGASLSTAYPQLFHNIIRTLSTGYTYLVAELSTGYTAP
jgi:hypothetical protein